MEWEFPNYIEGSQMQEKASRKKKTNEAQKQVHDYKKTNFD